MKTKTIVFIITLLFCPLTFYAQFYNEGQKIVASDRDEDDYFGYAVAISGNYAMVGADWADGIILAEEIVERTGAVYVFKKNSSGKWNEVQIIDAPDRDVRGEFGVALAISGNYAIIGAQKEDGVGAYDIDAPYYNAGSAYIFEKNNSDNWILANKINSSDREKQDHFGNAVGISGDYAIVGASGDDEDAEEKDSLIGSGSAYIFELSNKGSWNEVQKIVASDRQEADVFGNAVSISGDYAIVGAYKEDHDTIGENYLIDAGASYIFKRDEEGKWNEVQKIVASDRDINANFGFCVSISDSTAITSANFEGKDSIGENYLSKAGAVYIFKLDKKGKWNEVQKIVASDRDEQDNFGYAVHISGNLIVVGAESEDHNANGENFFSRSGSAYVFKCDESGHWNQIQKIVSPGRGEEPEAFGRSVCITDNHVIVGTWHSGTNANGIDFKSDAGAAYIFNALPGTGIKEIEGEASNSIKLYPNPVLDYLVIEMPVDRNEYGKITLYNQLGRKVFTKNLTSNREKINTCRFNPGIYYIVIQRNKSDIFTKKVIFQ